ncbi:hypothetical protein BC833DRAFT_536441 [Globomyces pollinis-pini]|nr:hypothetical protein BC833DRAFT_536441 [Globomyces pollinis-pini]
MKVLWLHRIDTSVTPIIVTLSLLLSILEYAIASFSLIPSSFLFTPWAIITTTLVHSSPLWLIINNVAFFYMGNYFELNWGANQFAWFLGIVALITNCFSLILCIFFYAVLGSADYYFLPIQGLGTCLCALIVAFKRAVPEHSISIGSFYSIRVKYIPSLNLLLHLILYLLGFISTIFYTHTIASIVSWVYIRYYKVQDGIRGDRSETFSFASFFPDSAYHYIKPLSTIVYTFLVKLKLLPPLPPRVPLASVDLESQIDMEPITTVNEPAAPQVTKEPFESTTSDAERRKALALQALEARMKQKQLNS